MTELQFDSFDINKAAIIAEIERGTSGFTVFCKWPELSVCMFDMCAAAAIANLNKRLYHHDYKLKTMRDVRLLWTYIEAGTFDVNEALRSGFTKKEVKAILHSSGHVFWTAGYRDPGDTAMKTVTDDMLAQINVCAYYIKSCFVSSKTWYAKGCSYNLKHSVERYTHLANELDPSQPCFYIANVSFILAAMLCGIEVRRLEDSVNAVFRMKPIKPRELSMISGE